MKYNHKEIEPKWQKYWEENKTFKSEVDPTKEKYYILDMFPYPSGAGLHVGHVEGYTATDILARYMRAKGKNVLHPMGWDSFGLPAEQYAIRTGTHPRDTTEKNINTFRRQLKSLGFSYDWDREVATSDPKYYKWTQWIFAKLFEKGLAYEAEMLVNYCPALGTVLANEEVEQGRVKEGGHLVERRPLKQWVLKITDYADRLLEDLDYVDWPDHLKRLQRNWIGRSEGARIRFPIEGSTEVVEVFTTRPDTIYGATYMVLSPEHPLVPKIVSKHQAIVVKDYQERAATKSDLDRTDLAREKTGVFTGTYALNPVSGERVPIWVSDYVLMGYGTGAVMSVPAHDERDFEFATTYDLPIRPVIAPNLEKDRALIPIEMDAAEFEKAALAGKVCWRGSGTCINSPIIDGLQVNEAKKKISGWLEVEGHGEFAVSYKLRDWLFSRQRYWGEPFPILHLEDGSKRVLGLDELPLTPPDINDFKPSGDGRSPLARLHEWVEIVDEKTGKKALRETNTMPQWAGSCWYYLRFLDPENDEAAWSPEKESYWMPVDMYVGGVEHAVLHLLYARFWHKVLYDCKLVTTREPFQTLRNQGLIVSRSFQVESGAYVETDDVRVDGKDYYHKHTGEKLRSQIEKMSKSKLNGVTPDEIIEEFGADALRLYEMFMGPLEKEKIWNTDAVNGCRRFLSRLYDLFTSDKVTDIATPEALKLGHRLVKGVRFDIEHLLFNTAIAKMMEFLNAFIKLDAYPKEVLKMVTQMLAPLAPHIAEEMWEMLGETSVLSYTPLPEADESYLYEESVTYIVQVNGKLRGRFELPKDAAEDEVAALAKEDPSIFKYLDGKKIRKVIFVPGKLLNIVVGE